MDNNLEISEDLFFEVKEKIIENIDINDQKEILNNLIYLLNNYRWQI